MQISDQCVALFHYTLRNDADEVIDSSEGKDPLAYLHGAGNIVPGLENALVGKSAGDQFKVSVDAAQGYGEKHDALVEEVPREAFQGIDKIEVGMRFQADSDKGPMVVTVAAVSDDTVTVDGNHPLAGETLHFDIDVVEVREASAEEKEHGHPHGPGGHHH